MKKTLLLFFFLLFQFCFAQNAQVKRTWHWYFGNGAGIDFSSGTAVPDTNGQLSTYEGCASISDTLGNLLFYTDGDSIWDRNHNVMPNGYGLFGCGNYGSSAQAANIIPHPGNNNQYIVITTDCASNSGVSGVRYTIVDMLLNSGNGDVDTAHKNILLFAPSTEACAITYQCNKHFFWVVAHEFNNNNYRVYSVDSNGVNTTPQIISIGSTHTYHYSQFRFSSDGTKLATAYRHLTTNDAAMLFNFDNQTGLISNAIQLTGMTSGGVYGPEFSFDNSKLYYDEASTYIHQFDISSGIDTIINNSRVIVSTNIFSLYAYLQKAPDGKIYISAFNDTISTIDSSNVYGIGCSVNQNSFFPMRQFYSGLPSFVSDYFYQGELSDNCEPNGNSELDFDDIQVFPNPAQDRIYVDGNNINSVSLVNIFGSVIFDVNTYDSTSQHYLNVSSLSKGIYLLKIKSDKKFYTKKIIIN